MLEAKRDPDKFIDWFSEQIKDDSIHVKLEKVNLFLQSSFEYNYDSNVANNPDAFGTKDDVGDFIHHYSEILSNPNRKTEEGLFTDDCEGYAQIAEVILRKAGLEIYTISTNDEYNGHATAICLFQENGKWNAARVGTYGLNINGEGVGIESHKPSYPQKNKNGYLSKKEALESVLYEFKKEALEDAKKDNFKKYVISEIIPKEYVFTDEELLEYNEDQKKYREKMYDSLTQDKKNDLSKKAKLKVSTNFGFPKQGFVSVIWTEKRGDKIYSSKVNIPLELLNKPSPVIRDYIETNDPESLLRERKHQLN